MKRLTCAAALLAALTGVAAAQSYPSRPITMVVPYPPAGPTDTMARIFAERMKTSLGQPVVVENAGGAGGSIGVARVARAAADGYTISFGNVASHVFSSIVFKLQYDVLGDLDPLALMTVSPMWLLARNGLPAKDLRELIAWLKANPDKATAAVIGSGSPGHLCGVYFQNSTGTRFQFVPYRGSAPAMQDMISGQIDLACLEASATRSQVRGGNLRAYAVFARERWPAAPEVPTVDEAGVPGLYIPFWHALWMPKGVPPEAVAKLTGAVVETLADPGVRARLAEMGVEIPPVAQQSPQALRAHHKAELDKWRPIIEQANIKPE
ncbi:MAG: tripartite tricarboxylate transporter substrate binding protein BugD [Hyphomicrobiales bacterium]|nr:tripartite tricarboxylate transporter substrate binding protein BugD [Hyphomicrobiales bacterium]